MSHKNRSYVCSLLFLCLGHRKIYLDYRKIDSDWMLGGKNPKSSLVVKSKIQRGGWATIHWTHPSTGWTTLCRCALMLIIELSRQLGWWAKQPSNFMIRTCFLVSTIVNLRWHSDHMNRKVYYLETLFQIWCCHKSNNTFPLAFKLLLLSNLTFTLQKPYSILIQLLHP